MTNIFLDNHSTTPLDPRVFEAMKPYFMEQYGNPSSLHTMGTEAKDAIETAREQVASMLGAKSDQIYFTSSATEANNIVLQQGWDRILATNTEHSSILQTIHYLQQSNAIVKLPLFSVNKDGSIDLTKLRRILKAPYPNMMVSIMAANNEIGTMHDLVEIGELCNQYGLYFHTDATQLIGKHPIELNYIDAITFSAHKIYGPKGVGVLYVKDPHRLSPIIHGGYQNTFTSGTQNVPGIVGLGKACALIDYQEAIRIGVLRDMLLEQLLTIEGTYVNGTQQNRLTNNINLVILGVEARMLSIALGNNGVMISGGAACNSLKPKPSHVLKAIKCPNPESALRIGLGRFNTKTEILQAAKQIKRIVKELRCKRA